MKQLIVVTGAKGVGKTRFATQYLPPSRIGELVYVSTEDSANDIFASLAGHGLEMGRVIDMKGRFEGKLPHNLLDRILKMDIPWVTKTGTSSLVDYWDTLLKEVLDAAKEKKYSTLVIDTAETFEAAMAARVETSTRKFGVTSQAYGKLWSGGVYPLYEQVLESWHQAGFETIILVFHLKNPWVNKAPILNKFTPACKPKLYQWARLFVWLVPDRSNTSGAPAGIVLKERMGHLGVDRDADVWVNERLLPERIPVCTWETIQRLQGGFDIEGRCTLSETEERMVSDYLSQVQLHLLELSAVENLQKGSSDGASMLLSGSTVDDQVIADLLRDGASIPEIAHELGISPKRVVEVRKAQHGQD